MRGLGRQVGRICKEPQKSNAEVGGIESWGNDPISDLTMINDGLCRPSPRWDMGFWIDLRKEKDISSYEVLKSNYYACVEAGL